jgi:hypothetical protein
MPSALVPLANLTLGSSASTVTFSSISGSYRDLMLITNITPSGAMGAILLRANGDTGLNYPTVYMSGNGSTAASGTANPAGFFGAYVTGTSRINVSWEILDYIATDKHKTSIGKQYSAAEGVQAFVSRWANTSAITNLTVFADSSTFAAGSSFALYGISA